MKNNAIKNITLSAMFLAIGMILPFFTGQVPAVGNMLLPMHLPVFLCALICGWQYGLVCGFILPLMRSAVFSMPVMYPAAAAMAFELAAYGFFAGFLYSRSSRQCLAALYRSLVSAMLIGRIVWGLAQLVLLGIEGNAFTLEMFVAGAFLNAVPGIVIQLIFIPTVMSALNRIGAVKFKTLDKKDKTVPQGENI